MGRMTHWPSIWCSKHFFSYFLGKFFAKIVSFYFFLRIYKEKNKEFWVKKNWWNIRWCSSQRPSNPAYHIEDCRISSEYFGPPQQKQDVTGIIHYVSSSIYFPWISSVVTHNSLSMGSNLFWRNINFKKKKRKNRF